MKKTEVKIIVGILLLICLTIFAFSSNSKPSKTEINRNYQIDQQWELPKILEEISGIAWLQGNRLACIQDEDGKIFIYNLNDSKIEKEIEFSGSGDYEDIVVNGNTAYVLRSDGKLFEVKNFLENPKVNEFETFKNDDRNVEGLAFDKQNNRLLLGVKEEDSKDKPYKGIYEFSLASKKFNSTPVFKVNLKDPIFEEVEEHKLHKKMQPSAIAISPTNGKMYILDGANPKLVIAYKDGKSNKLYSLDKEDFYQPEGIAFSPNGELYISNEGKKKKAAILKVILKNK